MTLRDVVIICMYGSVASAVLAFLYGLRKLRDQNKLYYFVLALLAISAVSDIASFILIKLGYPTNYHLLNFYNAIQFVLGSIIFIKIINIRVVKYLQLLTILIYLSYFVYILTQDGRIYVVLSFPRYFTCLTFMISSIIVYYQMTRTYEIEITKSSVFWLNTAIFIFFSGNFIFYLLSESLEQLAIDIGVLLTFHNVLGITKNVLLIKFLSLEVTKSSEDG